MSSPSTGHRAPLLWLVAPAMVGLGLAHSGLAPGSPWVMATAAAGLLILAGCLTGRPAAWGAALTTALVLMGACYGQLRWAGVPERASLPPREARLEIRVSRVFATEPGRSSGLGRVVGADRHLAALVGERTYWTMDTDAPARGATIELLGVLTPLPHDPAADSFDAYLENTGADFSLRRATFLRTVRPAPAYYGWCERLRDRLSDILGTGLARHPALAGLIRAMALGQKAELDDAQQALFRQSGVMHLFAVSGLHIGVIALVIELLLSLARLPAWVRFWVGTAVLWLYVDVIGAPPSAVRAFIMVFFLHAAWRWRVPGNALAALAAAALAVLAWAPEQMFSASFQLSYGIVTALLLLGLPLSERLKARRPLFTTLPEAAWGRREKALDWLWRRSLESLSLAVAAALVGLLGGVSFFGVLTPGAFVANLALVPLASLTLAAAVGAMLTGLLGASWVAMVFTHAAAVIAWAMQALVALGMRAPGMSFPAELRAPELGPLAIAGVVVLLGVGYMRRWNPAGVGLWTPVAWVVAVLVFGMRLA